MSAKTQRDILDLAEQFLSYLPDSPRAARLSQFESQMSNTHFAWIGGYGDEDQFYYKIHSPMVVIEFDHDSSVFLTNTEPAKCHIHLNGLEDDRTGYVKKVVEHPGRADRGEIKVRIFGDVAVLNGGAANYMKHTLSMEALW
jgi:hypothetical protein